MLSEIDQKWQKLNSVLGLDEEPMGLFYTDEKPVQGSSPKLADLPTRDKEIANNIDWGKIFGGFSCTIGHIWRARKKHTAAYFSSEQFGCPGATFYLGFMKPQTETIIHYVSTGFPNGGEAEFYCDSPDQLRKVFNYLDPRPAPKKYTVVKPITMFTGDEKPELVVFFTRPESLSGLHQLAYFVTNDPEVVTSPWGAACANIWSWPLHYLAKNQNKAVLGGWDPSARKYFKTDELSFTVPFDMYVEMLNRFEESFLRTKTWELVNKKINRSKKAWGETT